MNRNRHLRWFNCMIIALGFGCSSSSDRTSQPDPESADFRIVVGLTDDGVVLRCTEGCAWIDLTFSAIPYGAEQAVDNFGMTNPSRTAQASDSFLFTIQRTADGIRLRGLEGSLWTELSFECAPGACSVAIDENGIA